MCIFQADRSDYFSEKGGLSMGGPETTKSGAINMKQRQMRVDHSFLPLFPREEKKTMENYILKGGRLFT